MKTADQILKELAECENPVTVSSLKSIAISKLKQERDSLIGSIEAEREACALIADSFVWCEAIASKIRARRNE